MNSINATSVKDMIDAFPYEELPKIEGKPTLAKMMVAIKHLVKCARTFDDTTLGPMGMIFLVMSPQQYATYSQIPYVPPVVPGPNPTYPVDADDNQREAIRIAWLNNKKEYDNVRNMNRALIKFFLASMEEAYTTDVESDFVGIANQTFLQLINYYLDTYGRLIPREWQDNKDNMLKPWDPSTPITHLFRQINDSAEYARFANQPFAVFELVNAGELGILATGVYGTQYEEWRAIPAAARDWE